MKTSFIGQRAGLVRIAVAAGLMAALGGTALTASSAGAAVPATNVTAINALGTTGAPGSNGWAFTENDAPGTLAISPAISDPIHNDGSLYLATPTSAAHVIAQVAATGSPSSLSGVSYQTYLGQTGGAASVSIQAGAFCTGTSGFTTFVFEPYQNSGIQPVVTGQWQTWDASSGMWWSTHTFAGGGGQADVEPFASLMTKYMAACPGAALIDIGFGMGSNNPGTEGWADNLTYTTSTGSANWNFEAPPVTATNVTAINALGTTGAPGSNGWAFTENDAPGVLDLSSAVNDPIHNDGSLYMATPTTPAHVVAQVAASGPPSSLNAVSYQTYLGATGGAASISIQAGALCTGTSGFTTFVFEPYLNPAIQPVVTGQWQTWANATNGQWWSTHTFSGNGASGGGQADVESFTSLMGKYMTACPTASLVDIGLGMGSANPGTSGWADNLQYNTSSGSTSWNFESTPVPVTNVTAINALGATGATGSNGWAFTEDDAPGVLQIDPTVNDPIHNDGSLLLSTPDATAHVVAQVAASGAPSSLNGVSYQTFLEETGGAASISIQAGALCTGTSGFTTFVFEPYLNPGMQPVVTGQWQTWANATNGQWWSTHTFSGNGASGGGQADVESFTSLMSKYMTACPGASLTAIGVGMGSNNPGTSGWTDNLAYTTSAGSENWNFKVATAPDAPIIGSATASNAAATVSFTPPVNDGGFPVTSFIVTAIDSTTPANGGETSTGASSPIMVTGLTNGDSYTFTVRATNSVGTGPPSAPSNAVVPATVPNAPAIGTATAGNTTATVNFTAPADNGSGITSYTVTSADSTTPAHGGQTATGAASPLTVAGLTNGDSYTFTVTATNGIGTGPSSASSNAVVPATVPNAPIIGTATAFNTTATVAFGAPGNNGSAITSYTVTATDSTTPAHGGQTNTGASSPVIVAGLTNGDSYTFTVTATNGVGTGPASAPSNAVVPATVPGAPIIGTATGGNTTATVTFGAPATNNGSAITSYTVTATDSTTPAHGGQTATGTSSPITVTGLTNGDSYTFTVKATNGVGTGPASAASNSVLPVGIATNPGTTGAGRGYWLVASDGGIFSFGNAQFYGSTGSLVLNKPIIGMIATPDRGGYLLVASDGGVFAFGDAVFHGSASGIATSPIVGLAQTPDGGGYWMAGSNGQVYAFGDAATLGPTAPTFFGSAVVAIAGTPDGGGYWLALANGGVIPRGDAANLGSVTGTLNKPIVGIATTPDGRGYWLLGGDGGIFSFGDAQFFGSTGSLVLNKPVVGLTPTPDGKGYWLDASDGGIFSFGDAQFFGSTGSLKLNKPVVGMTST